MAGWRSSLELLNDTLENVHVPRRIAANELSKMPEGVDYAKVGDVYYPRERLVDIWAKNSVAKRPYSPQADIAWYEDSGKIPTEVAFQTPRIEADLSGVDGDPFDYKVYSYYAPNEVFDGQSKLNKLTGNLTRENPGLPLVSNSDIRKEVRRWTKHNESPSGASLSFNHPIGGNDPHTSPRAKLYARAGFTRTEGGGMVKDTRRRYGNPQLMDEVYRTIDGVNAVEAAKIDMFDPQHAYRALYHENPNVEMYQNVGGTVKNVAPSTDYQYLKYLNESQLGGTQLGMGLM